MKKRILKRVLALLTILAMLIPCLPVIASAADTATVTATQWNPDLIADDAYTWLKANCDADGDGVYVLDSFTDLAYFMACGRGATPKSFSTEKVTLGDNIYWNKGTATKDGFILADDATTFYYWEPYHSAVATTANGDNGMTYSFAGTFDGKGYSISGLYVNETINYKNVGFFAGLKGATVKNVSFENSYMKGCTTNETRGVSMVAGSCYDVCTFESISLKNCHVVGSINVGGIVGSTLGTWSGTKPTFENCVVDNLSTVTGSENVGAVMGIARTKNVTSLTNCVSYATVSGTAKVNALIGYPQSAAITYSNCASFGRIAIGEFSTATKIYHNGATAINLEMDDADNGVMKIEGVQIRENQTDKTKFDARFIASIDFDAIDPALTKKDFKQFGFEAAEIGQFASKTANAVQNGVVETVYTSIESSFGNVEIKGLRADQSDVKYVIDANYLATMKIEEIPTEGIQTVLVRSYYATKTSNEPIYGGYIAVTFVNGEILASTQIASVDQSNSLAIAAPLAADTYDMATLFPNATLTVKKDGVAQSGTTMALATGVNDFEVTLVKDGMEFVYNVSLARRAGHLVNFNANGGKLNAADDMSLVATGGVVSLPTAPTRANHTFTGWGYLDANGKMQTLSKTATTANVIADTTFIAQWTKNNSITYDSQTSGIGAVTFEGISAGLHVVWKDYANAFERRPEAVTCILTQTYGNTTKNYSITLKKNSVNWAGTALRGTTLTQGEGGAWTLSLENLPEKVGTESCTYTLTQKPLNGNYTSMQSGSACVNTLVGYLARMDDTAKLTTQNSRLYDAAGNMIVFTGVVSANLNFGSSLDNTISHKALTQMKEKGCNVLRTSIPLVGSNMYYVYQAVGSNFRTGQYSDNCCSECIKNYESEKGFNTQHSRTCTGCRDVLVAKGIEYTCKDYCGNVVKANQANKQEVIDKTVEVIDKVTAEGMYIIIDWTILTSNPNQYLDEACDYFGKIAAKYKDNPYVLYEICNEPGSSEWRGENGIKAYAEEVVSVIHTNAPDAVCIVAPKGASNFISTSPAQYTGTAVGDDPISNPVEQYNVAYTHHPYPFTNYYSDSPRGIPNFSWRLRDAYKAGLTVICTEMSPMAADLDDKDTLGYDFAQMNKYMRMFQEYDMSYCYFKYYVNNDPYDEWCMLNPKVNPSAVTWTRDDLTTCGQWYYDLITGDGVFVTDVDYNTQPIHVLRDSFETTFESFGLKAGSNANFFTVFPTFAVGSEKLTDGSYYFKVSDSDTLRDVQYQLYCERILKKIAKIDRTVTETAPTTNDTPFNVSYTYGSKACTLKISYGQHSDSSWGIFFQVQ